MRSQSAQAAKPGGAASVRQRWWLTHKARRLGSYGLQAVSALAPDRYRPYRFAGGRIYLNLHESEMMVQRALGQYEPAKQRLIKRFLRPGMTLVDVGANKGDFTLIAARLAGDRGTVLSFEPEPTNFHWLERSIALNEYRNVRAYRVALGDTEGAAQLYLGAKSGWHTLVSNYHRGLGSQTIETRTLDSVLHEAALPKADMIKIDVEGWELPVLRGAIQTLRSSDGAIVLLDLHPHLGADVREISNLLLALGFRLYLNCDLSHEIGAIPDCLVDIAAIRHANGVSA